MKYTFETITHCNMCGKDASHFKLLGKRLNNRQGFNPHKVVGVTTSVIKCKNCKLVFSNPKPIPESINQHYDVPPESYWIPSYFQIDDNYIKTQLDTFFELYPKKDNLKSLDVGAGIGKGMIAMERRGMDAYGFEPSKPFYEKAITMMKMSKEKLIYSSLEEAEYPKNEFDFITFGAVLEHLYDPSESLKIALNWLKPGGLIHIEVPNSQFMTTHLLNFMYRMRGLDYVAHISPMYAPFHLYEFDLKSFEKNAERQNCEIAHYVYMKNYETYLPRPLGTILKPIMDATNKGMQLEVWLRKK